MASTIPVNNPVYVFMIVSSADRPLFECDLSPPGRRADTPYLDQFVIYAALDVVDELVWQSSNLYLKQIDKFNDLLVSAYVTAGHMRFILLHRAPSGSAIKTIEEAIREFFSEVHELYIKSLMNPFSEPNGLISSTIFEEKLRSIAKRLLPGVM